MPRARLVLIRSPLSQFGSLMALDERVAEYGFTAGSYLYLNRVVAGLGLWGRGRARSMPTLATAAREQELAYEYMVAAYQGKSY